MVVVYAEGRWRLHSCRSEIGPPSLSTPKRKTLDSVSNFQLTTAQDFRVDAGNSRSKEAQNVTRRLYWLRRNPEDARARPYWCLQWRKTFGCWNTWLCCQLYYTHYILSGTIYRSFQMKSSRYQANGLIASTSNRLGIIEHRQKGDFEAHLAGLVRRWFIRQRNLSEPGDSIPRWMEWLIEPKKNKHATPTRWKSQT